MNLQSLVIKIRKPEQFVNRSLVVLRTMLIILGAIAVGALPGRTFNPKDLQRLQSSKTCPDCDLRQVILVGSDLSRANLTGSNLADATITRVNLEAANLSRVNLNGANLTESNLREANLNDANLEEANLSGANLRRAKLNGAKLESAFYDDQTSFPDGFNPDRAGMQRLR
ncbi:pentapeptide repeat-containing protein [Neosynechococcus sphagnicola]|uniref:pentapeptide repeat-containing protein n=1 Tax=Neosynechococcus sphagnicola TaxID=1501145 RepID=UPI00068A8279|nr:pentapeptide repeat-containing protein [Neosynechococcus sphagnicola]